MILHIYTIIHTLISFIAIFSGLVVVFGMLGGKRLGGWTKWFLITAVATTVTGFFFPFHGLTPAFKLGIISAFVLAITIYARYPRQLDVLALFIILGIAAAIRFHSEPPRGLSVHA
jgi:hypothetical protein